MPGLLDRSIDRELGPATSAEAPARGRESWLRDWPLLLGLVLSAALIAASTAVGGSPSRPKASVPDSKASGLGAVPGHVVDVGQAEQAAPEQRPVGRHAKAKPARHAARTPKAKPAQMQSDPAAAASDPAPRPRAKRAPSRASGGGSSSGGGAPTPGRIVNVTGTSATFANGPLSYSFTAPTHTPAVGRPWRLQISVKRAGAPMTGTVKVDILHNGAIVGHAASGKLASGRFAHDFDWPDKSVGFPLTVKTTVIGGGFQQSFLFNVKVGAKG